MNLLVIRASAMGDVALITPVIAGIRKQYPSVEMTILTRPAFESFFYSINGIKLFMPDFRKRHKGFIGIIRLYRDIAKDSKTDYVIDLHDVIRSKILRWLFGLTGMPVFVIDKGRREKRYATRGKATILLKHSVERYCDVFAAAGFPVNPVTPSIVPADNDFPTDPELKLATGEMNIGVAPYARHPLKMWPEDYMVKLLGMISARSRTKFWLFGGRDELERLGRFQSMVPGSCIVSGKTDLKGELALIGRLDFMISMDSSNMHMAALLGTKVISIWGGTDPITGFGAWQQPENYSIRIPATELTCRPCTVYGKGKCRRGDFACMNWLTPEKVLSRLSGLI